MEPLAGMSLATIIVIVVVYFLPTVIAGARHHHQIGAIMVLNLLLGCTLLGWIAAIVCAIIGLRRSAQRTLPFVALAIALGTPLVLCCGAAL